ncbi:MAG: transposase [Gemmataceae bacterium]
MLTKARELGITIVSRLAKNAALDSVPDPVDQAGRGRPCTYGKQRRNLDKEASKKKGWESLEVVQYGRKKTKKVKTYLATWHPAGGGIRVVIVKEDHGWVAFCCTDPDASVQDILEVVADRWSIEQMFADIKEVHGASEQQVRGLWSNVAVWHLVLWGVLLDRMVGLGSSGTGLARSSWQPLGRLESPSLSCRQIQGVAQNYSREQIFEPFGSGTNTHENSRNALALG